MWQGCEAPPDSTQPRHLYYQLQEAHGETDGKHNGLQWDSDENVICNVYQRASPASIDFDTHFLAVATDLVQRYDIDGLHLDHIRYAGRNSSCDPVSEGRFEGECFLADGYEDWQRQQVNGTVRKLYEEVLPLKPGLRSKHMPMNIMRIKNAPLIKSCPHYEVLKPAKTILNNGRG